MWRAGNMKLRVGTSGLATVEGRLAVQEHPCSQSTPVILGTINSLWQRVGNQWLILEASQLSSSEAENSNLVTHIVVLFGLMRMASGQGCGESTLVWMA